MDILYPNQHSKKIHILRSKSNQEHFVIASLIDRKSKEVQSRTQKGAVIFNHLISFLIR